MDLATFVAESLVGIENGVKEANGKVGFDSTEGGGRFYLATVGPAGEVGVAFDVAVTIGATAIGGAKGGMQIAVFQAGVGGERKHTHEHVSRISFKVFARSKAARRVR